MGAPCVLASRRPAAPRRRGPFRQALQEGTRDALRVSRHNRPMSVKDVILSVTLMLGAGLVCELVADYLLASPLLAPQPK